MNALTQKQSGCDVAEVVETDARQTGLPQQRVKRPSEQIRGIDWTSEFVGEDEVVVLPRGTAT